jgi:adhesin/invasin
VLHGVSRMRRGTPVCIHERDGEMSRLSLTRMVVLLLSVVGVACGGESGTGITGVDQSVPSLSIVSATDSQTAMVGTSLPSTVAVKVIDQNNRPIVLSTVTWAVVSGGGTVGAATSVTDASGIASASWTLGTAAGVQRLTATIVTGTVDTLVAFARAGAVTSFAVVSDPFVAVVAGAVTAPLQVRAFDQYGNGVADAAVLWRTSAGRFVSQSSVTSSFGVAQAVLETSTTPQDHVVTATVAGFPAVLTVRGQ